MVESDKRSEDFLKRTFSAARSKQHKVRKDFVKKIKGLKKSGYGNTWQQKDNEWYSKLDCSWPKLHRNFIKFLKNKADVSSVLEVGCGTGLYPIKNKELFSGMKYTGIDASKSAIEFCKKNSRFDFICGDFLKMNISKKYDLVFSHAVIDHIYDIDLFLTKIVKICKKYVYISAYRGYFPDLINHRKEWSNDEGCYYNDLSVNQLKKILLKNNLTENDFIIRPQESGQEGLEIETVIEINIKNWTGQNITHY